MIERQPLTVLQNGCFANVNRKVQRTYGRKGKASTAAGSKNFFQMADELDKRLNRFSIAEDKENTCNETQKSQTSVKDIPAKEVDIKNTRKSESPTRALNNQFDTSSFEIETQDDTALSPDDQAIRSFTKDYSGRKVLEFNAYGNAIAKKYHVRKIGEGSYSDVFALDSKDAADSGIDKNVATPHRTTIVKLMPILLPSQGQKEYMTEPLDIVNELQTMKEMDRIHGFMRYRGVVVVTGPWPANFNNAFQTFRMKNRKDADNLDPAIRFRPSQHYALIEMEDAGIEMNNITRPSSFQIYDIFWSTCIHLANAEGLAQFEHRDLHVSNVCIKPSDPTDDRFDVQRSVVRDMREAPRVVLGMTNIQTTLIDYTYSRATVSSKVGAHKKASFREFLIETEDYDNLAKKYNDETTERPLTQAVWEQRLQNLTYAKVAKCVYTNHEKATEEGRSCDPNTNAYIAPWEHHLPKTNVCWLAYLIGCLLKRAAKKQYVAGSNVLAKQVQDEIRGKLEQLQVCLMEEDLDVMPQSAVDVVRIGVERGWLQQAEIETFKAKLEEDS